MAVILAETLDQAGGMQPIDPEEVLSALKGRLDLSMVMDAPQAARYAVSAVNAANQPILTGTQAGVGVGQVGSAGVTSFNGRNGVVVPTNADYTQTDVKYAGGETGESLKPQEIGSNVTETRTSLNTANVDTETAATVRQGAVRANAAIDSGNVVVAGSVDFTRSYTNKTQDNIPAGSLYGQVGLGYTDASGRIYQLWDTIGGAVRSPNYLYVGSSRAQTGLDASGVIVSGLHPFANLTGRTADQMTYTAGGTVDSLKPNEAGAQYNRPTANLLGQDALGPITYSTSPYRFNGFQNTAAANAMPIATLGLSVSDVLSMSAYIDATADATGTLNAVEFQLLDASFNSLFYSYGSNISPGAAGTSKLENITIPANTVYVTASLRRDGTGTKTAKNAMLNVGPTALAFQEPAIRGTRDTQDQLPDGPTYARIKGSELTSGLHKIGQAGSGYKTGDIRNNDLSGSLGLGFQFSANPITLDSSGNMSLNAFTAYSGNRSASYNAITNAITGLPIGPAPPYDHYVFYLLDDMAGGTPTVYYLSIANSTGPTASEMASIRADNMVYLGYATIPASGSTSGTSNPKVTSA